MTPGANIAAAPPVLLGYQQTWIADRAPVKICEKSRRVGLSWAEAADAALTAAQTGGMDVWYVGYNHDMAQEFIRDVAFWAIHYQGACEEIEEDVFKDEDKDIRIFRIRFASGHKVTALSSRPSNLRGKQGRVIIDEAAFHDNLEELLKAALALLMWGGEVRIISTHNGDDNPFNELLNDVKAGKKPYSHHRIDFDEALSQGLYKRICLARGKTWSPKAQDDWRAEMIAFYGDAANEELFCIPAKGSGLYMARLLLESCMDAALPVIRWAVKAEFAQASAEIRERECADFCRFSLDQLLFSLDKNCRTYMGSDFGRSGDLSVDWPLQELPGLIYRTPFVLELRNVPFEQQRQIYFYLGDALPRFSGAALDARGNGQYLAEVAMQRYGAYRISQVMLTQAWYMENMPPYKAAYEDKRIIVPRDADILDDHRAIRMEKGVAKVPETYKGRGRDGGQRHGDSAIAGAMAWYAVRTAPGAEYAYESVGRSSSEEDEYNIIEAIDRGIRRLEIEASRRQTHVTAGFRRQEGCL